MNLFRRIVCFTLLIAMAAGLATAQTLDVPLNHGDPFSIRSGSTFSASGGIQSGRIESGEFIEKPSRIAADIREAENIISRNYINGGSLKLDDSLKAAVTGMLRSLDPHSNFYDPTEWREMLAEQRSGYTGIGATIANYENSAVIATYILATFPGSPAARSHLRYGDKIVAINGERMSGISSDIVRDKIRGASGTTFRLTLERASTKQIETVEIRRNRVPQPSIPDAYILRPGVGYIDLSEGFNYTTSDEFSSAIQELKRSGMQSLVLDLRGNGGGIVDQAVKIAEYFLPAGILILTQRGRTRIDNRIWKSKNTNPLQMPLVVLVNEDTASASEIVAGAFQDDDRAMIVGEKTFGKGLVQSVIDLPGSTGLTLTTGRYLTPSGRSIQRDYSRIQLYDYFNHKSVDAEIGKPYFEARTITDRRVFGGDGIEPDEVIKAGEISRTEISLLDPIFIFARELVNGRTRGHENYRSLPLSYGQRVTPSDFPVTDLLITAFEEFISKNREPKYDAGTLRSASAFIKLRLRHNIIMASFGAISANQVLIEDDPQVAKAIEALPRAATLAQSAATARKKGR